MSIVFQRSTIFLCFLLENIIIKKKPLHLLTRHKLSGFLWQASDVKHLLYVVRAYMR